MPDSREERRRRAGRAWTVAGRLRIRSPEDPPSPAGALEIVIEPAPGAFGTGRAPDHAGLPRAAARARARGRARGPRLRLGRGRDRRRAAGMGAGLRARLRRARRSIRRARNAERNGVAVRAVLADLREIPPPPAHTLVANVPLEVHERIARRSARPPGTVIASGITAAQEAAATAAYARAGLVAPRPPDRGGLGHAAAGAAVTLALLDPSRAATAGAPHGQLASAMAGGLRLSCHKLVEDAARATILLVPGLLRLDVRPLEDSLQVFARALHPVPPRWAARRRDRGRGRDGRAVPARMARRRAARSPPGTRPGGGLDDGGLRSGRRALRGPGGLPRGHVRSITACPSTAPPSSARTSRPSAAATSPGAVDAHLRELADELEGLRRPGAQPVAAAASAQVQRIIEAAESTAGAAAHGGRRGGARARPPGLDRRARAARADRRAATTSSAA